jgi:hypothetical protein
MPRIVPSQVVTLINRLFPPDQIQNTLGRGNAGQLAAIVNLVDGIPEELLTMDSDSYAGFLCGTAHIRQTLTTWASDRSARSNLDPIPGFPNENAVGLILNALAKCPDQSPAPSAADLKFIPDDDLRTNLRNDISAVNRALSDGEWKSATVLAGSAIKALLLWALQRDTAAATKAAANLVGKTLDKSPPSDLESWVLHHYIEVATALQIITADTTKQARLAKNFRNLIHPGKAKRVGQKCDRALALSAVAGLEHVIRDLEVLQAKL